LATLSATEKALFRAIRRARDPPDKCGHFGPPILTPRPRIEAVPSAGIGGRKWNGWGERMTSRTQSSKFESCDVEGRGERRRRQHRRHDSPVSAVELKPAGAKPVDELLDLRVGGPFIASQ